MANDFYVGDTVICSIVVSNAVTKALVDPSTSVNIIVKDSAGTIVIVSTPMTHDSLGNYHYDYQSAGQIIYGIYSIIYTLTDGIRVSVIKDTFNLVAI